MGQIAQLTPEPLAVGQQLPTFAKQVKLENMVEFERVVWDRGKNSHSDLEAAKQDGLTRPLASGQNQMAFIHELLERSFADAWVYGGTISVRYIHPVYAGDRITPNAKVTAVFDAAGQPRVTLEVWCENQDGQKTAAGTATAGQPVAKRTWVPGEGEGASP